MALDIATVAEATTAQPLPDLTPSERRHLDMLERRIERGMQTFREVGLALLEIRDKRLYRLEHNSFDAYCRKRWDMGRGRAYQLIGAAQVAEKLPGNGHGPASEVQARELVPLLNVDPDAVEKVWDQVTHSDAPVTPTTIREAVRAVTGKVVEPTAKPSMTDRVVADLNRLSASLKTWKASKPGAKDRKRVRDALAEVVNTISTD